MITWGISANSHDAALAVFCDKTLVFASHSERFSKIKNDPNLHQDLINHALQWGVPSSVYWYEKPILKSIRQLFAGQGLTFKENNVKNYLKQYGISAPIHYTTHHHSHAATGYFTSPFDEACVVVIDAIGEYQTLSIWQAKEHSLKCLYELKYPDSVGLWYSAMTQRIGLKPNEEEYILMGMAAYGDPSRLYNDIVNEFVTFLPNDVKFKKNLHRGCKNWRLDLHTESDMFDIAAATQQVYEDILNKVLIKARRLCPSDNLVLMGGCALNCSANRFTGKYFNNVWIYPNPGDAGSAIGTVLAHNSDWRKYSDWSNPFLGYDMGYNISSEEIVDYLINHQMCGVARGPAEFGPRALGNRSLLADPRGHEIKDRVNEIKRRQKFRPFAPVILAELVHEYFNMPISWDSSPYMQVVARCRHPDQFPAIVHADGTSRVQTVAKDDSEIRKLLEQWYAKTGCPMLLNTSLNIKGQPMVNDHTDAAQWSLKYGLPVLN